jgi:hypothetical protein
VDIWTIFAVGALLGFNGWKSIIEFANSKKRDFFEILHNKTSLPGVDLLARTIRNFPIDESFDFLSKFAAEFINRSRNQGKGRPPKSQPPLQLAIDGNTLNGTFKRDDDDKPSHIHIVNVVCNIITLTMRTVSEKSNEITAIAPLLQEIHEMALANGIIISTDAMGCQEVIAKLIDEYSYFYFFNLKKKQPKSFEQVDLLFKE